MYNKTAFQSEMERELLRMSANMLRLLNWAQEVDATGRALGPMIAEICDRWTEAERVRNLIRVRVTAGGEARDLQDEFRSAIRDLRLSMSDAEAGRVAYLPGAEPPGMARPAHRS